MRRLVWAWVVGGVMAGPAPAHDFWLEPVPLHPGPGATVSVPILVGHATERHRWAGGWERLVAFRAQGPGGVSDHQAALVLDPPGADAALVFATPGPRMLGIETTHATSVLPPDRFAEHLAQNGLTPAVQARAAAGTTDQPGREIYSRRAKALIQVGPVDPAQDWVVTQALGHTLELVPLANPLTLAPDADLVVQVRYRGRPLAGALVRLSDLALHLGPVGRAVSDDAGLVRFRLPRAGAWVMTTVWTRPLRDHDQADFDTTFASLTFGFPR